MSLIERWRIGTRLEGRYGDLVALARRTEHIAHRMNDLGPPRPAIADPDPDVVAILRSACGLLERAERDRAPAEPAAALPKEILAPARPLAVAPDPPVAHAGAGPSAAQVVDELIVLRDMLRVAADADTRDSSRLFAALDRKVGRILSLEGVRTLAADGRFDDRHQSIVETRPTADEEQDEMVCATVRPGYAVGDRVLRPQEVVVLQFQEAGRGD